jgi:hypothetical protein
VGAFHDLIIWENFPYNQAHDTKMVLNQEKNAL